MLSAVTEVDGVYNVGLSCLVVAYGSDSISLTLHQVCPACHETAKDFMVSSDVEPSYHGEVIGEGTTGRTRVLTVSGGG